jgi:hypothetical protein
MNAIITVIGSASPRRDYEPQVRHPSLAKAAVEQVGRELATRGLDLAVYSGRPEFIECDVVRGYIASGCARPPVYPSNGSLRI